MPTHHANLERPLSALDVIFTRRSVRAYTGQKLDQPTIRSLIDAAARAPNAGTLIVICGESTRPFVAADCWLAAENLMLAACALGLGTCVIGAAVDAFNSADAKEEFRLAGGVCAVAPILVGVPAGPAADAPPRREPDIIWW